MAHTKTLGDRLAEAMRALGKKQAEFAAAIPMNQSYLSAILRGKQVPSARILLAVQTAWGVSPQWLETGVGPMFAPGSGRVHAADLAASPVDEKQIAPGDSRLDDYLYVPILAVEAAAGLPMAIDQEHVIDTAVIHRRRLGHGRYVCVTVKGDSMAPILTDGYLCAINLNRADPRELRGHIVAAYVFGGLTLKWLSYDHGKYMLVPENRAYGPIYFDEKDARIVGAVEWWEGGPEIRK